MSLDIPLIRASFEKVKPIANEVVSSFYENLFTTYPESKKLFENVNLEKQKKSLISSLVTIVTNLDNSNHLTSYLKKLGARHVKYGTKEEHYAMVGKTLISTFRQHFGPNWTHELEDQWILAIGIIADYMLQGAKEIQENQEIQPNKNGEDEDIPEMVRLLARNLLLKVLEQEIDGEFLKIAKKKASNVLNQALREEAERIQEKFNTSKKAS